jgi:hypothetical protein
VVTPQVLKAPASIWRKRRLVRTRVGIERSMVVPSPTAPSRFKPQHQATLSIATAQVWYQPAATWRNVGIWTPSAVEMLLGEVGAVTSSRQAASTAVRRRADHAALRLDKHIRLSSRGTR